MVHIRIYKIMKWDRKSILRYQLRSEKVNRGAETFSLFGTLVFEELFFNNKDYIGIINQPPHDLELLSSGKYYPCLPLSEQELHDLFNRYGK